MKKIMIVVCVLCLLLASCASARKSTIYFTDGSTVTCDRVRADGEWMVCIHVLGILNETREFFPSEDIERVEGPL